ncbi:MAG: hypothetical protein EU550_01235 [Promethearchaeota archaeon]|nr:MAG: hypothetical protein EU550_01235 [Candidatus Lokiarchaeota archaeon]
MTRIRHKILISHIKEWKWLRRKTLEIEKGIIETIHDTLSFSDTKNALIIYRSLQDILSKENPSEIQQKLSVFLSSSLFLAWKGRKKFLESYKKIFTKYRYIFSEKAMKYITPMVYKAWRGAIRILRRTLEKKKREFSRAKYLILMNPDNMNSFHRKELRRYLKTFPWLRKYRKTLVKFYYQFKIPPEKRRSLKFLSSIISKDSHKLLKSAVRSLIENEDDIFRYQKYILPNKNKKLPKSIKVVNESANKTLNTLYRVQCGMRTPENLQMRISYGLNCPVIISSNLKEKIYERSNN